MIERIKSITIIVLTVMLFSVWQAYAGNPAGPGTPPASTSSYTLSDLYNRLNAGTAGSQSTFTEPSVAPSTGTMHTLNDIMAKAPTVDDTNGATTANVATGKTFWGLTSGQWALQTGTASPKVGLPATGHTVCYDTDGQVRNCAGTGEDGEYQLGRQPAVNVNLSGRFTDNGDGTVTDNLTGLIWLKNAYCTGAFISWQGALDFANTLYDGSTGHNGSDCGLNDGSSAGDWRVPNIHELESLVLDSGQTGPGLPSGHPFTNVLTGIYWSSTTRLANPITLWTVNFAADNVQFIDKQGESRPVWLVRNPS